MPDARPRSCPTCHSIGAPQRVPGTGLPGEWCRDAWHQGGVVVPGELLEITRPSHVAASSPTVRSTDPLVRELADGLNRVTRNYEREGSGPGSRFEGRLLEDVQAEWAVRELLVRDMNLTGLPTALMPAGMTISSLGEPVELVCRDHGVVLAFGEHSLRTIAFEARRHWREHHA
jgi:hypothetical protein